MRATTAVILARGLGTRMRASEDVPLSPEQRGAAALGAKGLMPFDGRPLLDFVLHELAEGGVREVVFVVAPEERAMRERYGRVAPPTRLAVRFAEQAEPRGTADALLAARTAVGAAPAFLVLNADNLYPAGSVAALVTLGGPGLVAYEAGALAGQGNIEAARVLQFALVDIDDTGHLRDIVEKPGPDHPLVQARSLNADRWVSMNLWRFKASILDDCAAVSPSVRGELELVDAVRAALARGERFKVVRQRLAVLDLSRQGDIPRVEALLAGRAPRP
jgi:glucose-1-phosphate thymidylyltransferase